ncbi:MAG: DUF1844 domain-containing protein [Candidatus Rokubacteria bacterium]|nr:DUF1844 domain-containing protein [Candidatus Rokubacteria bacterium]
MTETGPDEGFKVTDRRRRVEAGEIPRGDAPTAAREPTTQSLPTSGPGPPAAERSLAGLFMMLASSAAVALGELADPVTGEVHHDPAEAAEVIDLLILLREKTEGNRTAEETQILEELIYDLQLRYVNAAKRP